MRNVSGRELIGGLGLGYSAQMLARRKRVQHVVVIEKSPEVVKMVAQHLRVPRGKLTVIVGDLFDFLDDPSPGLHPMDDRARVKFDWAFYDIWASDSERTFHKMVLPLIRKSVGLVDPARVLCWNENIMRAQLNMGLWSRCALDALPQPVGTKREWTRADFQKTSGDVYHDWSVPFFQWAGDRPLDDKLQEAIEVYAGTWGRPGWEERWNAFVKENE